MHLFSRYLLCYALPILVIHEVRKLFDSVPNIHVIRKTYYIMQIKSLTTDTFTQGKRLIFLYLLDDINLIIISRDNRYHQKFLY